MTSGYSITSGSKLYFMPTKATKKTKNVVNHFIECLGKYRGLCDNMIERCKSDEFTFKDVQKKMCSCTLEKKLAGTVEYYHIEGSNFIENIPLTDADCLVIF